VDSQNYISSKEEFRQFMDLQWEQQEQNGNMIHIEQQQNHQVQPSATATAILLEHLRS